MRLRLNSEPHSTHARKGGYLHWQGLAQPAYNTTTNWFTNPPLPNNQKWSEDTLTEQYQNNVDGYPAANLPPYADGAYAKGAKRQAAIFDYNKYWQVGDPDPKVCVPRLCSQYGQRFAWNSQSRADLNSVSGVLLRKCNLPQELKLQMIDSFDACFKGGKGDGQPNNNCVFT